MATSSSTQHLTPSMLDRLRRLLDDELGERRALLVAPADDEDAVDESATERELTDVLAARNAETVRDLEAALARLDAGTYGTCERCGTAIPFERLEAMPHARLCVACPEFGTTALFG
jgi:RNA polymerase-binding transcription factor DksA